MTLLSTLRPGNPQKQVSFSFGLFCGYPVCLAVACPTIWLVSIFILQALLMWAREVVQAPKSDRSGLEPEHTLSVALQVLPPPAATPRPGDESGVCPDRGRELNEFDCKGWRYIHRSGSSCGSFSDTGLRKAPLFAEGSAHSSRVCLTRPSGKGGRQCLLEAKVELT